MRLLLQSEVTSQVNLLSSQGTRLGRQLPGNLEAWSSPCGKFNFKVFALLYDPTIQFLGKDPGKKKQNNHNLKRHRHPSVHCSTVCNTKTQKQSKCPRPERRTKDTRHAHKMGITQPQNEHGGESAATWMDPGTHLSEGAQRKTGIRGYRVCVEP